MVDRFAEPEVFVLHRVDERLDVTQAGHLGLELGALLAETRDLIVEMADIVLGLMK